MSEDADVLFTYGAGIHPEFLKYLPTFNCYFFCDDPEDSPWQSAKVATAFDAACYANIAAGFQYESWGCQRHSWLPIFTAPSDVPGPDAKGAVMTANRLEDVVFGGGLDDYASYRGRRLRRLSKAFPDALCYGRGWPKGEKNYAELAELYLRTKLGWNVHRTTGPINRRMFQLPAHGVMQICDNKTGLGKIFDLGQEVVGFDTIDEAIELTKYYLEHDSERDAIARAGYERFWKDYHAGANWARLRNKLLEWGVKPGERKRGTKQKLPERSASYFIGRIGETISKQSDRLIRSAKAARREYVRKDPWWKVYDRVFTSESVYLPDYGDAPPEDLASICSSTAVKAERSLNEVRARQGAIRWAMTQLVGNEQRVGISDPEAGILKAYAAVDPKRYLQVVGAEGSEAAEHYDLLLCIPNLANEQELPAALRRWAAMAPRAVFAFPQGDSLVQQSREVYWLLKSFYDEVSVFRMPDTVVPWLEPAQHGSELPLVAAARKYS